MSRRASSPALSRPTDGAIRIASAYMPNGNPIGTEKFAYKLAWLERLEDWARDELASEEPLVIAGDYNIIPEPIDAKIPGELGDRRALSAGGARRLPPALRRSA